MIQKLTEWTILKQLFELFQILDFARSKNVQMSMEKYFKKKIDTFFFGDLWPRLPVFSLLLFYETCVYFAKGQVGFCCTQHHFFKWRHSPVTSRVGGNGSKHIRSLSSVPFFFYKTLINNQSNRGAVSIYEHKTTTTVDCRSEQLSVRISFYR